MKVADEIYDQLTPRYYRPNPETEDLLIDGTQLKNGMVVMIVDFRLRVAIPRNMEISEDTYYQALQYNRWCVVTELRHNAADNSKIDFTGVYLDGWKFKFSVPIDTPWYVKKTKDTELICPEH